MITMTLFLIMAGIGVGAYYRYYVLSLGNTEINQTLTLMKQARSKALKNPDNSDYGILIDSAMNRITSFNDPYSPTDPDNVVLELRRTSIQNLNLAPSPGSSNQIIFETQTGKTQNTGDFTIGDNAQNYTFTINAQGVIQ